MPHHFIDRRLNPKDKSLGNRQRFLKRVRSQVKRAVDKAIQGRNIADADKGETVSIPTKGISQPKFRHSGKGGYRERVLPGNKEFQAGDKIEKPPAGGAGGGGKEGADQGEEEDEFVFALSREEFLDLFFEDLELPDLIKRNLKEVVSTKYHRAGFSRAGSPANINVLQTMRHSLGRRLALKRPKDEGMEEVQQEIFALKKVSEPTIDQWARLKELHKILEELQRKRRVIAYIDPLDVRYNYFQPKPEPNANAVMFCLMDTSASMGGAREGSRQAFFRPAAPVPETAIRPHRRRFHPPYARIKRSRRENLLLCEGKRRHRRQHCIIRNAESLGQAISAVGVEYLCSPSIRR